MPLNLINARVIESSAFIAAPLAGLTLAQHGADVIRVDMIGGGIDYARMPTMPSGRSLYWTGLNKGKRSIAIDLRKPEGRELVAALVGAEGPDAGVLLTNIGVPWLAHDLLAKQRADVITCVIEGNPDGSTAVDYTVNCATGFPTMTGHGSIDAPVNHSLPAWDLACAYQAAFAVLAALDQRRRTGLGAELRLSLADVAFSALSHLGLAAEAELLHRSRPSLGNHIYGAFGHDFATSDGQRVMVAGISAGQWKSLVRACALDEAIVALEQRTNRSMAVEENRYEAREEIAALVAEFIAARPFAAIAETFEQNKVCWGKYETTQSLMKSDARVATSNPVWQEIDTPGVGRHRAADTVVRQAGEPSSPIAAAPLLGAHTDAVLSDVLGLMSGEIGRLHDAGVVAGPERDPTCARA